jgi:hypothetical protein
MDLSVPSLFFEVVGPGDLEFRTVTYHCIGEGVLLDYEMPIGSGTVLHNNSVQLSINHPMLASFASAFI